MQYQQVKDANNAVRTDAILQTTDDGTVSYVPNDPANRNWAAYQVWLADGNTPIPAN